MLLLPALLAPLVFGLAIFRLYQIPRKLWSGELRLPDRRHIVLLVATVGAYLALLGHTLALSATLVRALFLTENRMSAYLPLLIYVAAYPFVYFGAAWVFYYGLKPDLRSGN